MARSETTRGKAPAFQFYPKDFLTDSNVVAMSMSERGAYMTLLCFCWIDGTLPADEHGLARLCGVPVPQFRRLWGALSCCFRAHPHDGDRLIHPRLEREREKQAEHRLKQSNAGYASAAARASQRATTVEQRAYQRPTESGPPGATSLQPDASSSICDLQPTSATPLRSESRPVWRAALTASHRKHARCGVVCVPASAYEGMLAKMGGDQARLDAWITRVNKEWQDRVDSGHVVPEGDDFAFWRARWSEHHGHVAKPLASARTLALARATEEFLA